MVSLVKWGSVVQQFDVRVILLLFRFWFLFSLFLGEKQSFEKTTPHSNLRTVCGKGFRRRKVRVSAVKPQEAGEVG